MSLAPPPARRPSGIPVITVLAAGTDLHRIHGDAHPAHTFNPTPRPTVDAGGRFDSTDGSYAYTYLGADPEAAVAEVLCRDLPGDRRPRMVPRVALRGRSLTVVRTTRELRLLSLHGPDATQVGAGLALTKGEAREYLVTRAWARALLTWLPQVDGFTYRCRHDEDRFAHLLVDDAGAPSPHRARGGLVTVPGTRLPLTSPAGEALVRDVLRRHNATLGPRA